MTKKELLDVNANDLEWLRKYLCVVAGLHAVAESAWECSNSDCEAWGYISCGLEKLSKWLKDDIEDRVARAKLFQKTEDKV